MSWHITIAVTWSLAHGGCPIIGHMNEWTCMGEGVDERIGGWVAGWVTSFC